MPSSVESVVSWSSLAIALLAALASWVIARSNVRRHRLDLPEINHEWRTNMFERRPMDDEKFPRSDCHYFILGITLPNPADFGISEIRAPWYWRLWHFWTDGICERGTIWRGARFDLDSENGDGVHRPTASKAITKRKFHSLPASIEVCVIGRFKEVEGAIKTTPNYVVIKIQKKGYSDAHYSTRVRMDQFSRSGRAMHLGEFLQEIAGAPLSVSRKVK